MFSSMNIVSSLNTKFYRHARTNRIRTLQLSSSNTKHNIDWPVSRVRSQFIDYFVQKLGHINYKSSPVVPVNDPTLLFANAGMNQFKPIFLGTVDPSSPYSGLKRVVNSQKCIRAGGKHNDLDDVGKDTYHHTFFEMLGTWSFGNYFKEESIDMAYDILVNTYKLPAERLYVSYFGGDEAQGLPADHEARDYWLKYLPTERILPFDKKANFWEMGETGPCGPCSEIHFDRIGNRDASALVNADDPNVIEIWNLVFIQFNREKSGKLRQLPDKHIDTGMGLERLTSILQQQASNYDTDVFGPIFLAIHEHVGSQPYGGRLGAEDASQGYRDTAYRIIADHIRTLSFAITDGAVPSNEGRGYVLRRVLRRAVRYGMQNLHAKPGFFAALVPVVVSEFGDFYPELKEKQDYVMSIISEEEQSFALLVEQGIKYFNEIVADMKSSTIIPGERAFYLYDSLGFPIDLTQIMAHEQGLTVDISGFRAAMDEQKERSRAATRAKRLAGLEALTLGAEQTSYLQKSGIPTTDDAAKYLWDITPEATVMGIYTSTGIQSSINTKYMISADGQPATIGIILERTSFYAESGGQIADTGSIMVGDTAFEVVDVQVFGGYVLHLCVLSEESIASGHDIMVHTNCKAHLQVDYTRRRKIAPNHTMTHVLNYALREELKTEVDQKGSQVSDEKLRFDFSLNRGMQVAEVAAVEKLVNAIISEQLDVSHDIVPLAKAQAIHGLRAVFGEVYPDPVRVVLVGAKVDDIISNPALDCWKRHSVEFCGGTHISNTRYAKAFVIIEETAVAKGIRRISALTGDEAVTTIQTSKAIEHDMHMIKDQLKSIPSTITHVDAAKLVGGLPNSVVALRNRLDSSTVAYTTKHHVRNALEKIHKEVLSITSKVALIKAEESIQLVLQDVQTLVNKVEMVTVLTMNLNSDPKVTKKAIDEIRKATSDTMSFLVVACDHDSNKVHVFAYVTDHHQKAMNLYANEWVNKALASVGGRGGGIQSIAQGIAGSVSNAEVIVNAARERLKHLLKV